MYESNSFCFLLGLHQSPMLETIMLWGKYATRNGVQSAHEQRGPGNLHTQRSGSNNIDGSHMFKTCAVDTWKNMDAALHRPLNGPGRI